MDETLKIKLLYCEKKGPNIDEDGQITRVDPNHLVGNHQMDGETEKLQVSFGSSPDVHGGELAAISLSTGVRKPLRCACGARMRFFIYDEFALRANGEPKVDVYRRPELH